MSYLNEITFPGCFGESITCNFIAKTIKSVKYLYGGNTNISKYLYGGYKYLRGNTNISKYLYSPNTNISKYLYGGNTKNKGIQIFRDTGKLEIVFQNVTTVVRFQKSWGQHPNLSQISHPQESCSALFHTNVVITQDPLFNISEYEKI